MWTVDGSCVPVPHVREYKVPPSPVLRATYAARTHLPSRIPMLARIAPHACLQVPALVNAGTGHITSQDDAASTYATVTPPPPGFDLQAPCRLGAALENLGHTTSRDDAASTFYGRVTPPPPDFDLQAPRRLGAALENAGARHLTSNAASTFGRRVTPPPPRFDPRPLLALISTPLAPGPHFRVPPCPQDASAPGDADLENAGHTTSKDDAAGTFSGIVTPPPGFHLQAEARHPSTMASTTTAAAPHLRVRPCPQDADSPDGAALANAAAGHATSDAASTFGGRAPPPPPRFDPRPLFALISTLLASWPHFRVPPCPQDADAPRGAALENAGHTTSTDDAAGTFYGRVTPPPGLDLQAPRRLGPAPENAGVGHTTSAAAGTFDGTVTPPPPCFDLQALGAALESAGAGHTTSDAVSTFYGRVTPPPPGFDLQAQAPRRLSSWSGTPAVPHFRVRPCPQDADSPDGADPGSARAGHTMSDTASTFYGRVTPPPPGFDLQAPRRLGAALENTGAGHTTSAAAGTFDGTATPPPPCFDLQALGAALENAGAGHTASSLPDDAASTHYARVTPPPPCFDLQAQAPRRLSGMSSTARAAPHFRVRPCPQDADAPGSVALENAGHTTSSLLDDAAGTIYRSVMPPPGFDLQAPRRLGAALENAGYTTSPDDAPGDAPGIFYGRVTPPPPGFHLQAQARRLSAWSGTPAVPHLSVRPCPQDVDSPDGTDMENARHTITSPAGASIPRSSNFYGKVTPPPGFDDLQTPRARRLSRQVSALPPTARCAAHAVSPYTQTSHDGTAGSVSPMSGAEAAVRSSR